MTITVDARPGVVRALLIERNITPIECEWDDAACVTTVTLTADEMAAFVRDVSRYGLRWWRGRPRYEHNDPTYAQAAQRILRRERGQAA